MFHGQNSEGHTSLCQESSNSPLNAPLYELKPPCIWIWYKAKQFVLILINLIFFSKYFSYFDFEACNRGKNHWDGGIFCHCVTSSFLLTALCKCLGRLLKFWKWNSAPLLPNIWLQLSLLTYFVLHNVPQCTLIHTYSECGLVVAPWNQQVCPWDFIQMAAYAGPTPFSINGATMVQGYPCHPHANTTTYH